MGTGHAGESGTVGRGTSHSEGTMGCHLSSADRASLNILRTPRNTSPVRKWHLGV